MSLGLTIVLLLDIGFIGFVLGAQVTGHAIKRRLTLAQRDQLDEWLRQAKRRDRGDQGR